MGLLTTPDLSLLEKGFWTIIWIILCAALSTIFLRAQKQRRSVQDGEDHGLEIGVTLAVSMVLLGVGLISAAFPYGLHHVVLDLLGYVYGSSSASLA